MKDPVLSARVPKHVKDYVQEQGVRELVIALYRGLQDGTLEWDGVCLSAGLDTRDFVAACERKKRRPEDVLRAITEQIC